MSDNLFWLKLSASAALGAFALWNLFGEEDEPAELTNTQKLYFDLGLGGMGFQNFNIFLSFEVFESQKDK